eukprot:m.15094 g.15094  ORF g.15094 m.15094 type:complete len:65 (-) comp4413_c0_seq1:1470-1664(-)
MPRKHILKQTANFCTKFVKNNIKKPTKNQEKHRATMTIVDNLCGTEFLLVFILLTLLLLGCEHY